MVKTGLQNGFYACIYRHTESGPDCADKYLVKQFAVYSGDEIFWGSFDFCIEIFW